MSKSGLTWSQKAMMAIAGTGMVLFSPRCKNDDTDGIDPVNTNTNDNKDFSADDIRTVHEIPYGNEYDPNQPIRTIENIYRSLPTGSGFVPDPEKSKIKYDSAMKIYQNREQNNENKREEAIHLLAEAYQLDPFGENAVNIVEKIGLYVIFEHPILGIEENDATNAEKYRLLSHLYLLERDRHETGSDLYEKFDVAYSTAVIKHAAYMAVLDTGKIDK